MRTRSLLPRSGLLLVAAALASCSTAPSMVPGSGSDHRGETPAEMQRVTEVLKANMHERGQAKMSRLELDDVQRLCNAHADNPPAEQAKRAEEAMLKAVPLPEGSLIGDWKKGEKIAQSGRGMTWSDKPGVPAGGSCYNCHQISPKVEAYGTIGPSLAGFGKNRGNRPEIQRYVYGKIYNAKAYNVCSTMPRFGTSGTLSDAQIRDLVALLLDPASPVNQ
jgi:sulfur-oxidizing protein SoxX